MDILTKAANALKSVFLVDAETVNAEATAVKRRRKFTPATLAQTFILAFLKSPMHPVKIFPPWPSLRASKSHRKRGRNKGSGLFARKET